MLCYEYLWGEFICDEVVWWDESYCINVWIKWFNSFGFDVFEMVICIEVFGCKLRFDMYVVEFGYY